MMKFIDFLRQATSAKLVSNQGTVAITLNVPDENSVGVAVQISWDHPMHGPCSTLFTADGLAGAAFNPSNQTFNVYDHDGDLYSLRLMAGTEVLTPTAEAAASDSQMAYVVIQEGGSSAELYIHAHDWRSAAETDRRNCYEEGSYRTTEVIEVPVSLLEHPAFFQVANQLLKATFNLSYPADAEEDEE